jgi:hypothetical protein
MVLAPLEPCGLRRRRRDNLHGQGAPLDHGAPFLSAGLMFEKSSHWPTRYR